MYQEEIDISSFASKIEKDNRRSLIRQRAVYRSDDFQKRPVIKYFSETFNLTIRLFEDVKKVSRFYFKLIIRLQLIIIPLKVTSFFFAMIKRKEFFRKLQTNLGFYS